MQDKGTVPMSPYAWEAEKDYQKLKRRDLIKYFGENWFSLLREGARHSIYTSGIKTIHIGHI
jgi:hypothetical protein